MSRCEIVHILKGINGYNVWKNLLIGGRLILTGMLFELLRTFVLRETSSVAQVEILALELFLTMAGGYLLFRSALAIYYVLDITDKLASGLDLFSEYLICRELGFGVKVLVKSIISVSLTIALGAGFFMLLKGINRVSGSLNPFKCWASLTFACNGERVVSEWDAHIETLLKKLEVLTGTSNTM